MFYLPNKADLCDNKYLKSNALSTIAAIQGAGLFGSPVIGEPPPPGVGVAVTTGGVGLAVGVIFVPGQGFGVSVCTGIFSNHGVGVGVYLGIIVGLNGVGVITDHDGGAVVGCRGGNGGYGGHVGGCVGYVGHVGGCVG